MARKILAQIDSAEKDLAIDLDQWLASHSIVEVEPGVYSVLNDGHSFDIRVHAKPKSGWSVEVAGRAITVEVRDPRQRSKHSGAAGTAGRQSILAPMPGKIVRVLVQAGDIVEAGQGLIVVEAMKMQNEMKSPKAGTVSNVLAAAGATVAAGDTLLIIE